MLLLGCSHPSPSHAVIYSCKLWRLRAVELAWQSRIPPSGSEWGKILHARPRKSFLLEVTALGAVYKSLWFGRVAWCCFGSSSIGPDVSALFQLTQLGFCFPKNSQVSTGYEIRHLLAYHAELLLNSCSVLERMKWFLWRPCAGWISSMWKSWWDWEGAVVVQSYLYLAPLEQGALQKCW